MRHLDDNTLSDDNTLVDARQLHMEILDAATREVWQSRLPVSPVFYRELDLAPGLVKIGIGRGAMDAHGFRRSPGAAVDGPLRTREFAGQSFVFCAMPMGEGPTLPGGEDGPRRLLVDKHHTVIYCADRSLHWLRLPDGSDYVHVIDAGPDAAPIALPDGWTLSSESLSKERTIELPHPTTVFFFPNGDSYQGPIER